MWFCIIQQYSGKQGAKHFLGKAGEIQDQEDESTQELAFLCFIHVL